MIVTGCSCNAMSVCATRGLCSSRCFNNYSTHSEADAS